VPLAFCGHLSRVVWLKPPWSDQVPRGSYVVPLGVDPLSGCVRTPSSLQYYVSGEQGALDPGLCVLPHAGNCARSPGKCARGSSMSLPCAQRACPSLWRPVTAQPSSSFKSLGLRTKL
jgi:hypothetical protein